MPEIEPKIVLVTAKFVVVALVLVEFSAVKFCKVVEAVVCKAPVESILKSSVPAALFKRKKLPAKPVVEEALIKLPVVVVAKRPKSAFEALREFEPRAKAVVMPFGERKRLSVLVANLEFGIPPLVMVLQLKLPADQIKAEEAPLQVVRPAPKKFVVLAVVAKRLVVVAFVVVAFEAVMFWKVEEALAKIFTKEVRLAKLFVPLKPLLLESKVEEAALIVMSWLPLKAVPLMFRVVCKIVAV